MLLCCVQTTQPCVSALTALCSWGSRAWRPQSPLLLPSQSQIQCRFFMQQNGRCPFKSDCIYLHQLPDKAPASDRPYPESMQQASGSEVVTAGIWGRGGCWLWLKTDVCDKYKTLVCDVNDTCLTVAPVCSVQPAHPYVSALIPLFLGRLGLKWIALHLFLSLLPGAGPNSVARGRGARGRSIHRLYPRHGLLGFRTPAGSQQFLPGPLVTRVNVWGMGLRRRVC